jgi:hypothetical protein
MNPDEVGIYDHCGGHSTYALRFCIGENHCTENEAIHPVRWASDGKSKRLLGWFSCHDPILSLRV